MIIAEALESNGAKYTIEMMREGFDFTMKRNSERGYSSWYSLHDLLDNIKKNHGERVYRQLRNEIADAKRKFSDVKLPK